MAEHASVTAKNMLEKIHPNIEQLTKEATNRTGDSIARLMHASGTVDEMKKEMERGNPEMQHCLATRYYEGRGVQKDDKEALRWALLSAKNLNYRSLSLLEKMAKQGNASAQYELAIIYLGIKSPYSSLICLEDYEKAAKYFEMAAKQGNPIAQAHLGMMYLEGKGVPMNYDEADKWLKQATATQQGSGETVKLLTMVAELGNAEVQRYLGWMYQIGQGVVQNDAEAEKWIIKASEKANVDAKKWLVTKQ